MSAGPRNVILLWLFLPLLLHAATKRALIVGIDTYWHPGTQLPKIPANGTINGLNRFDMPNWPNLRGATADAKVMRDVLTSPKFGFAPENVHMLLESDATRDAMLKAMRRYLVDEAAAGDTVVFYYAGHGSLRFNSKSEKNSKRLDNTIVPSDANTGQFDVRDREIARILNTALDKGVHVTAIFDSCHSGSIARGVPLGTAGQARVLPGYDPRDINEGPDMRNGVPVAPPEDRKDNAALVFTATEPDQLAQEQDFDGQDHGAFTVALVEALRFLPADTTANDLYKRVKVVMEAMGLRDQQPILDGSDSRKGEPLFGGATTSAGSRVAVAAVGDDGSLVLDSGIAGDIGPGSELARVGGDSSNPIRIRVTKVDTLARSEATVISQSAAKVEVGDLFEINKWVPLGVNELQVWAPPATLHASQIAAVLNELATLSKSETIDWVVDPAVRAPDYLISWDGKQWNVRQAGSTQQIGLGSNLSATSVLTKLPKKKVALLVNLPPPQELSAAMQPDQMSPLRIASSSATAKYVLVGTYAHENVAYAWVSRDVIEDANAVGTTTTAQTACSTASPYPARTDWKQLRTGEAMESTGRELMAVATQLARIHQWLQLPVPPADTDSYPYHLELKRDDSSEIQDNATSGDHVSMFLKSEKPVPAGTTARWVYVLDLDCQGNGTLLYPKPGVNNRLPARGSLQSEIPLEQSGFRFGAPFGTDTLILLTTNDELPDPSVLKFKGVSSGAARGAPVYQSPLENLLGSAAAGKRGTEPDTPLPTSWGVQYTYIHTHASTSAESK